MATLTPQFFQLLEADQKQIFFKSLMQQSSQYDQLFDVKTSNKGYEDRMRIAGLGTFATKAEGSPIAFDDPVQGARVRTVHQTYGLGHRLTMEMMQDDLFGIMRQMPADLGDSASDHRERLAWSLLDDAFDGNTYTGLESERLFLTTHSNIKTGGTQSNMQSPAVALSVTGLEAMLTQARQVTSDEGRFIDVERQILLIHPDNEHTAFELLHTEYKTGSSDNDRSTVHVSRSGLVPLIVPYLTSATAWSVHAPVGKNSLCWNNRMALEFKSADDAETYDKKYYAIYRASVMFSEWRGSFGSNF